jgi:hypothetical protein
MQFRAIPDRTRKLIVQTIFHPTYRYVLVARMELSNGSARKQELLVTALRLLTFIPKASQLSITLLNIHWL